MKFTVDSAVLKSAVKLLIHTVGKETIKDCLRFEARKGSVDVFSACGVGGSCYTLHGVDKIEAGTAMIVANGLISPLTYLDGDIKVFVKNNHLHFVSDDREYKFVIVEGADKHPFRDEFDSMDDYMVEYADINESIKSLLPVTECIRRHDQRGITLMVENKKLRLAVLSEMAGGTELLEGIIADREPVILPVPACAFLAAIPKQSEQVAIGINKTVIVIQHAHGYSYFVQLAGRVMDWERIGKALASRSKSAAVVAGIFDKSIRAMLALADSDEGNKGKLTGKKGNLELLTYTKERGAARDKLIIAGDLKVDNWYNFRTLRDLLATADPDSEIKLSTVTHNDLAVLILELPKRTYWLASCGAPYAEGVQENRR